MPLNVLLVASEAVPLAKTGGLGDMVSAYAAALREAGVDATILLPAYPNAIAQAEGLSKIGTLTGLPGGDAALLRGRMPDTGVPVLLLRCDALYARTGLYQDAQGRDYPDNAIRFATLSAAAVRIAQGVRGVKKPDIVHAHDWHTGLTPLLMKHAGVHAKSVFTIHNLAFQGNYALSLGASLGVPEKWLVHALSDPQSIEFYGALSLMKAGIVHADRVTTVSETYAREILTPRFGHLMEGVLQSCADKLLGRGERHRRGNVESRRRSADRTQLFIRRHARQARLQARAATQVRPARRSVRAAHGDRQPHDRSKARRCRGRGAAPAARKTSASATRGDRQGRSVYRGGLQEARAGMAGSRGRVYRI